MLMNINSQCDSDVLDEEEYVDVCLKMEWDSSGEPNDEPSIVPYKFVKIDGKWTFDPVAAVENEGSLVPTTGQLVKEGIEDTTNIRYTVALTAIYTTNIMTKIISLNQAGEIVKTGGGKLIDGFFCRIHINHPTQILSVFDTLDNLIGNDGEKYYYAFTYGVTNDEHGSIVTKKNLSASTNGDEYPVISRTKDYFDWHDGPGVLMMDYDPETDQACLSKDEWLATLCELFPPLAKAPVIWLPSSSSCIYNAETGEELQGIKGQRLLVLVTNTKHIPDAGEAIKHIIWDKGYGYIKIGEFGRQLVRNSLLDTCVWSPERLDYVGGAAMEYPLVQKRAKEIINGDNALLDLTEIINLGANLKSKVDKRIKEEKQRLKPQSDSKRRQWAMTKAKKSGIYERHLMAASQILLGDHVLYTDKDEPVTVLEILNDPVKWHEVHCYDPLDGLVEGGDNRIATIYSDSQKSGYPVCYSHAHGGIRYDLYNDKSDIVDRDYQLLPSFVRITSKRYPIKDKRSGDKKDDPPKFSPRPVQENFDYLLDRYGIQLRYNVIIKKLEGSAPYLNSSGDFVSNGIRSYIINLTQLNRFGSESSIDRFLERIQFSNQYNPVTDYLKNLKWDGSDRFPDIMATLGTEDKELARIWVKCLLLQAVAAADYAELGRQANPIMRPQFGYVPVLVGHQGIRKGQWFKNLLPKELQQFIGEGPLDPRDRDSKKIVLSKWIYEVPELDGLTSKCDAADLKRFLTHEEDEMRLPYDRDWTYYQRRTMFVGSVNETHFLHDITGNRRFIPLPVESLDNTFTDIDLDQVWAQAWQLYTAGTPWWGTAEEEQFVSKHTDKYRKITKWEDLLWDCYDFASDERRPGRKPVSEILLEVNNCLNMNISPSEHNQIVQALKVVNITPTHGAKAMVNGKLHAIFASSGKNRGWLMPPVKPLSAAKSLVNNPSVNIKDIVK